MTDETEIWGELTATQFQAALARYSTKFGPPKQSKRLALQADSFNRHDLDTRVRISNGQAELLQKVGPWEATTRQEIQIPLDLSADHILNLYKILINQLPASNHQTSVIQYQNYIFDQPTFELKLGKQTGKQTAYHYEIEASQPNTDLDSIRTELRLPKSLSQSDENFWTSWNKKINLNYYELSDQDLLLIIKEYLS